MALGCSKVAAKPLGMGKFSGFLPKAATTLERPWRWRGGADLTVGIAAATIRSVTLTLELSDLRSANERALAQLSHSTEEEFDAELAKIEFASRTREIYVQMNFAVSGDHLTKSSNAASSF